MSTIFPASPCFFSLLPPEASEPSLIKIEKRVRRRNQLNVPCFSASWTSYMPKWSDNLLAIRWNRTFRLLNWRCVLWPGWQEVGLWPQFSLCGVGKWGDHRDLFSGCTPLVSFTQYDSHCNLWYLCKIIEVRAFRHINWFNKIVVN